MNQNRQFAITVIVICMIAVTLSSCENHSVEPGPPPTLEELIAQTPRENREAEEMALWLSSDLVAPEALYLILLGKLELLREQWKEDYPYLDSIKFTYSTVPSYLSLNLTDDGVEEFRADTFYQLDSLNQLFRIVDLDSLVFTYYGPARPYYWLRLTFKGLLNPAKLSESYIIVPNVRWANPDYWIGDRSCIYPVEIDGGVNFLLRQAWGDCPSGCIYSDYTYFMDEESEYSVIGNWIPAEDSIQPVWWEEVQPTVDRYRFGVP